MTIEAAVEPVSVDTVDAAVVVDAEVVSAGAFVDVCSAGMEYSG